MDELNEMYEQYTGENKIYIGGIITAYEWVIASYEMTKLEYKEFENKTYLQVAKNQSNHIIDLLQDELIQSGFMEMIYHGKLNIK